MMGASRKLRSASLDETYLLAESRRITKGLESTTKLSMQGNRIL